MPKKLFTSENAAEKGKKGGIKSGESRRMKRDSKILAEHIFNLAIREGNIDDINSIEDAKGKNLTVGESIYIAQVLKALKGDNKAAQFCFDYAGMKPITKVDMVAEVNETNDELSNILNILTDYKNEKKKGS